MTIEYYSPGQLSVIYPFLKEPPKWLLLGGPADANEAQTAKAKWPDIKIIGIEPNPEAFEWQMTKGEWPKDAILVEAALGEACEMKDMVFEPGLLRNGSLRAISVEPNRGNPAVRIISVPTVTLDALDNNHGPFEEAVLWIDIEGSELPAIKGAAGLLARNAIRLVNAEGLDHSQHMTDELEKILYGHDFTPVKDWNDSPSCRDRIYVRGWK